MNTSFSHIIQKRFSHVNKDIATRAYIIESSGFERKDVMELPYARSPGHANPLFQNPASEVLFLSMYFSES